MGRRVVRRAAQGVVTAAVLVGCLALDPTVSARPTGTGFHLTIAITGHGGVRQDSGFDATRFVVRCPRFDPDSLNCPADERWTVTADQARVTAIPAAGWKLLAWHGACTGTKSRCTVHNRGGRDAHVSAVFVATMPGLTSALPVPVGHTATIARGAWRLKVVSVTPDAKLDVPPSEGAQDVVARVKLTYIGGGKGTMVGLLNNLLLAGAHKSTYAQACPGATVPPPELTYVDVFSGVSVTGNVCWQIARNDAASVELFVGPNMSDATWFALR
jgi:hypothetical protein